MKIHEFDFQKGAVTDIAAKSLKYLTGSAAKSILLEAPTGAGKTVTAALALEKIAAGAKTDVAFIWLAPNKLHQQSMEKLISIYSVSKSLQCIDANGMSAAELSHKQILFLNWSSVNKEDNVLRKDKEGSETGRTLKQIIAATRSRGCKICLIIDESHKEINGAEAKKVRDLIIKPDVTLEISATPVLEDYDYKVQIDRVDVVAAGVVRKEVIINPGFKTFIENKILMVEEADAGDAETLMSAALHHQMKIRSRFHEKGLHINPLILVQFPDGKYSVNELARLEDYLTRVHGISEVSGRLAVWLSEDKRNLTGIEEYSSKVDVLFFKQAIATGWDCPRSHILVSLREIKSPTLGAQVLGRVLRQPFKKHLGDPLLDCAYVFSNTQKFKLEKDVESFTASRLITLKEPTVVPLPYDYARYEQFGSRLNYLTADAYAHMTKDYKARLSGIKHIGKLKSSLVSDIRLADIDFKDRETVFTDNAFDHEASAKILDEKFDLLIRELASGTAGQIAGKKYIRRALLDMSAGLLGSDDEVVQIETILHANNRERFVAQISSGIKDYLETIEEKGRQVTRLERWKPLESLVVKISEKQGWWKKSLYSPVQEGDLNGLESEFAKHLDKEQDIAWWIKNRNSGSDNFGIQYTKADGKIGIFYIDFIVKYVNGSYGLFDTKGHGLDGTANWPETVLKANALQGYIKSLPAGSPAVRAGIVVQRGSEFFINDSYEYRWDESLTGWSKF